MGKIAYRKEYRMRLVGRKGIETTIPKEVIERAARQHGLTIEEFAKQFRVVHFYNDFDNFAGAYRFEPINKTEEIPDIEIT